MGDKKKMKLLRNRQTSVELYRVQPYYQRFNQKYAMNRQPLWDETAAKLRQQRTASLEEHIKRGHDGYSILDQAFKIGSHANQENTGFNALSPNRRGNSWGPAADRGRPGSEPVSDKVLPKWRGSPEEASRFLRNIGLRFGADQVGFCLLDRRWVYSHWLDEETKKDYPVKFSDEPGYEGYSRPAQLEDGTQVIPKEMQYVLVLLFGMDKEAIDAAPTLTEYAETDLGYSKISFTMASVAETIRGLGYHAIPSANCTALSIPLAIDAGLGQLGRNAKLINPAFGPRCRIAKVITDLPLAADKPIDFGVTEFCDRCRKCARICPAGAIPLGERSFEPVNECGNRGVLQWQLDHKKCYQYEARVGTNCGICLRTCPFNKDAGRVHDVVRWFIKNVRLADPLFIKLDDVLGYGKYVSPRGMWKVNGRSPLDGNQG